MSGDGRPSNLHVSESALGLARLPERMERKFFVVPERAGAVLALLRRICRYDTDFPEEQINSLYFDTPDLDQHERSISGEYTKDKVRIRWYGVELDPHRRRAREVAVGADHGTATRNAGPGATAAHADARPSRTVRVWLERKSRQGFASTKQREVIEVAARALEPERLGRGIVPTRVVVETMAGFGFYAPGPMVPVVLISYWRHRFTEPVTGFRVALDSHVRSTLVRPGIGHGERALELPGVIVEVKGPRYEVPPTLRSLAAFGTSWTRFSKYSSSLDAHVSRPGSVSRLWPSGVMVEAAGCPVRLRSLECSEILEACAAPEPAYAVETPICLPRRI